VHPLFKNGIHDSAKDAYTIARNNQIGFSVFLLIFNFWYLKYPFLGARKDNSSLGGMNVLFDSSDASIDLSRETITSIKKYMAWLACRILYLMITFYIYRPPFRTLD
jgi:hypothetical protein